MNAPDNLIKKTLWWTKWQTWFAGLGVVLAIVFGWSTIWKILVASGSGLMAGVRVPVWMILLLVSGGVIWALRLRRGSAVPSEPPMTASKAPARPEEATIDGVLWRWTPNDFLGRVGDLKAFCPTCDLELDWQEEPRAYRAAGNWTTTLWCARCPEIRRSHETYAAHVLNVTRKIIEAGLRKEEAGLG